ncbi:MAG: histidine kinase [Anaerorhabdus sp.]
MIHKLKRFLRKIGIRQRLMFAFIVLPLGLMLLFFFLYYSFNVNVILNKQKEASQRSVALSEEIIRLNMNKVSNQIKSIMGKDYVYKFLENETSEEAKKAFSTGIENSIYLGSRKGTLVYNVQGAPIYDDAGTGYNVLEKQRNKLKDGMNWMYDEKGNTIYLAGDIIRNGVKLGTMFCGFDEGILNFALDDGGKNENAFIILDKEDTYLFGNANFTKGTRIDSNKNTINMNGESYYLETKQIQNTDWKIMNLVASDYVFEELHNFRNMLMIYGVMFFVILIIVASFIYHSIYDPLHNILKSMNSLDENNLMNSRVYDEGKDEIHEVSTNFNDLLNRVQELLETVESEQEQKRETQFQLLQAQINPHFLFNTLNTLHFMAIMNEDKPVSEGISALAKLLRNTIIDSKEVISVKEELENVKNYIIIQKLRFGDLFETVYNIDENVMQCDILKLLLQPIVENSILHAFEEDKEHQILTIRIRAYKKFLKVEIGDNGKGFISNNKEVSNKKLSSIGINNIQERISLMYGEEYSMKIQSVVNKGTIVTLWLPLVKEGRHVQSINSRR